MTIMSNVPLERQEQRTLVAYLRYHPVLKDFFCKNDNEGIRTESQGHNVKLLGLRPGVSDLFIYYPTKTYYGLWIELKRNKKYVKSERNTASWRAQELFLEQVKSVGYQGFICYGFDDAKKIIDDYLLT